MDASLADKIFVVDAEDPIRLTDRWRQNIANEYFDRPTSARSFGASRTS